MVPGFTASNLTTNDGIGVIEASGGVDQTIDVSAAGGANGWTLIGAPDAGGAGNMSTTLIGSDNDDTIIDGAAFSANNLGKEDTLTGNDGEDVFQFNLSTSDPAEFDVTPIQAALDVEYIDVDGDDGGTNDDTAALITIEYQLNNVTTVAVVNDTNAIAAGLAGGIDFSSQPSIAAGIAAVMDNITGISASVDTGDTTQVNLEGDNGNLLNINTITPNANAGGASAVVRRWSR